MVSQGRYLDLSLEQLLEEIASPTPAPGAGFVAAVTVAMAAGLVAMTARLSPNQWPDAKGAAAQAEALRLRVSALAELNAEAYVEAVSALGGERGSSSSSRDDAIAEALERSAQIPLQIGEAASDVGTLAATVAELGEPSLRADAAVAASLSLAGARAAVALVEVNLGTVAGDDRVAQARSFVAECSSALDRALAAVA